MDGPNWWLGVAVWTRLRGSKRLLTPGRGRVQTEGGSSEMTSSGLCSYYLRRQDGSLSEVCKQELKESLLNFAPTTPTSVGVCTPTPGRQPLGSQGPTFPLQAPAKQVDLWGRVRNPLEAVHAFSRPEGPRARPGGQPAFLGRLTRFGSAHPPLQLRWCMAR